jgi:hypothetical protein
VQVVDAKSTAVQKAADLSTGANAGASPQSPLPTLRPRSRPAAAFELGRAIVPQLVDSPTLSLHDRPKFCPPLISIGPHSDVVLDKFKLGDDILPRLHTLLGTVRSSLWEDVLKSPEWNLSREQAVFLTRALLADVNGTSKSSVPVVQVGLTNRLKHSVP